MDLGSMYKRLLDSEEMQFYINHFGIKKNPTYERIKSWSKERLLQEETLIRDKKSSLSRKERDTVLYFAQKRK